MAANFFTSLRRSTRSITNVSESQNLINALKNASTFNTPLRQMLDQATFDINPLTSRIRMNNSIDMNRADSLLRRGELRRFADETQNVRPSTTAEAGFRTSIANETPDIKFREMDEAIMNARRAHADIDLTPNPNETADMFRARLTPSANLKLDGILQKIKALGGTTLIVGGVVVIFIVGLDLLQSLIDATNNRRGCFRVTTTGIGNATTSCRVLSRTCFDPRDPVCDDNFPGGDLITSQFFPTNVRLVLARALTDQTLNNNLKNALNWSESITTENVQTILNNTELFLTVAQFHLDERVVIIDPCMTSDILTETLCRACDTSVAASDQRFVDLSGESDTRMSLTCIPSSTILDTIVDIGIGNGVDLLSPFGQFSNSNLGTFVIITLVVVLLIIISAIIFTLIRKNK